MIVKKGYTKLKIPHEGGELTFQYPAFKGTYGNVANEIDKAGLKRPNSSETASLVYEAWKNPKGEKEPYFSEIISILKNHWLWEFTGNLYLPKSNDEINNGVILETNPKIKNGKLVMNKNSLVKRLKENDSLVKFVPFGYKTGEQSPKKLAENKYIIARYGEQGAEKIAKITLKYKNQPNVYSFNSVDEEKIRMSALGNGWIFNRLNVNGNKCDDNDNGHAFGIKK